MYIPGSNRGLLRRTVGIVDTLFILQLRIHSTVDGGGCTFLHAAHEIYTISHTRERERVMVCWRVGCVLTWAKLAKEADSNVTAPSHVPPQLTLNL